MDSPENVDKTMNPQITSIEVGARKLRELTIYPLAMGDQIKLEKMVELTLVDYYTRYPEGGDIASLGVFISKVFVENIYVVLGLVTDKEGEELEILANDLTNMQSTEIVKLVYETNFLEPYEKNLKSLPLMDKVSQLVRQLQGFSESTPSTESMMSTEKDSGKEDSLKTNSSISIKRAKKKS